MPPKDEIRAFILDLLQRNNDTRPVSDNDSLLVSGRLQSVDAVEIVIFLEQRYGIDFSEFGFDRDKLDSIDQIAALVATAAAAR